MSKVKSKCISHIKLHSSKDRGDTDSGTAPGSFETTIDIVVCKRHETGNLDEPE